MRISLCMIVRDEQDLLPGCLASVGGVVDETVIADTGSTDRTGEVAEKAGATVFPAEWQDDFAKARNQAIDRATGDWILILDADERLSADSAARLRRMLAETQAEALRVLVRDHVGGDSPLDFLTNVSTRIFRNRPAYRYERRIHEQIEPAIVAAGLGFPETTDLVIDHYGYQGHVVKKKNKRLRNLRLLEEEARAVGDPFAHYNLGIEFIRHERYAEALAELTKAEEGLDPRAVVAAETVHRKTACLVLMQRYEEALGTVGAGLERYPDFPDLSYQRGEILFRLHRYREAIEAFARCREIGDATASYYSLQGIGAYRAAYAIGLVYHDLREFAQALEWYRRSLQESPGHRNALLRIAEVLKESLPEGHAVDRELARYFDFGQAGARQAYLQVLFAIDRHEAVWPLAAELIPQQAPGEPRILLCGATSALRCREYPHTLAWTEQLVTLGVNVEEALLLKIVAHWCRDELPAAQAAITRLGSGPNQELFAVCQQMQWYMEDRNGFAISVDLDDGQQRQSYVSAALTAIGLVVSCGERRVLAKVLPVMGQVKDLGAWVRLGLLYFRFGQYDLAKAELEDCEQQGAVSTESLFALGKLALGTGETRRAVDYLLRSLELEPHNIEPRLLLAGAYRRLAEEVLLDGIERHPDARSLITQLDLLRKGGGAGGTGDHIQAAAR